MRYLAVDDEAFALDDLEEALREVDPEYKLARFTMPSEALDYAACERGVFGCGAGQHKRPCPC